MEKGNLASCVDSQEPPTVAVRYSLIGLTRKYLFPNHGTRIPYSKSTYPWVQLDQFPVNDPSWAQPSKCKPREVTRWEVKMSGSNMSQNRSILLPRCWRAIFRASSKSTRWHRSHGDRDSSITEKVRRRRLLMSFYFFNRTFRSPEQPHHSYEENEFFFKQHLTPLLQLFLFIARTVVLKFY